MKQRSQYLGILLGVVYGLFIRLLGEPERFADYYQIFSITFMWITPMVIGLFPILFASNELYKSKLKLFFYPVLTVILFLITAVVTQIEDLVCLLILGLPFLIGAGVIGLFLGLFVKRSVSNKKLYSIILLPLFLSPIENTFPNKTETFAVSSDIIINKSKVEIFPKLLDVPSISDQEYSTGFYQAIGIPRPVDSKTFKDATGWYRIGTFTDNLILYETISAMEPYKFVNFKIDLHKSQLREKPTDQHVLKSNYFNFENINYSLVELSKDQTKVILNCDYKINSKMNFYANFWARSIILDFEKRLLAAIKIKLEH